MTQTLAPHRINERFSLINSFMCFTVMLPSIYSVNPGVSLTFPAGRATGVHRQEKCFELKFPYIVKPCCRNYPYSRAICPVPDGRARYLKEPLTKIPSLL